MAAMRNESPVPTSGFDDGMGPDEAGRKATERMASDSAKHINSFGGGDVLKYKHLYGTANTKAETYYNLKPAAHVGLEGGSLLACGAHHWAVPWGSGGGGPVYVARHGDFGKWGAPGCHRGGRVVDGHKSPVLALAFSPFKSQAPGCCPSGARGGTSLLATGSDDQRIQLWRFSDDDDEGDGQGCGDGAGRAGAAATAATTKETKETKETAQAGSSNEEAVASLAGHRFGVRSLGWHPTAPVLASGGGGGGELFFWDVEQRARLVRLGEGDLEGCGSVVDPGEAAGGSVNNFSFNYDGSLLAVATKKSSALVVDPRRRCAVVGAASKTESLRGHRVTWCTNFGGADALLTVGQSTGGAGRFLSLWDPRNLSTPTAHVKVDSCGGQLLSPVYDEGTGVVLISGRGDTTIKIYELGPSCAKLAHCGDCALASSSGPLCGWAALPTAPYCDVANVETMRVLRLTSSSVEPVSFKLPRSQPLKAYFQDDIFVDARGREPTTGVADWWAGRPIDDDTAAQSADTFPIQRGPSRVSLRPAGMPLLSERPTAAKSSSSSSSSESMGSGNPNALRRSKIEEAARERAETERGMLRLQALASQRARYHPNNSMGAKAGVDATPIYDSDDSDGGGWSDDEED